MRGPTRRCAEWRPGGQSPADGTRRGRTERESSATLPDAAGPRWRPCAGRSMRSSASRPARTVSCAWTGCPHVPHGTMRWPSSSTAASCARTRWRRSVSSTVKWPQYGSVLARRQRRSCVRVCGSGSVSRSRGWGRVARATWKTGYPPPEHAPRAPAQHPPAASAVGGCAVGGTCAAGRAAVTRPATRGKEGRAAGEGSRNGRRRPGGRRSVECNAEGRRTHMKTTYLSRRRAVQGGAVAVTGLALAACAPEPQAPCDGPEGRLQHRHVPAPGQGRRRGRPAQLRAGGHRALRARASRASRSRSSPTGASATGRSCSRCWRPTRRPTPRSRTSTSWPTWSTGASCWS